MTEGPRTSDSEQATGPQRLLAILLAMAMFVLVVDTSLMNVSISSVVRDLDTTVSGVQVRDRARGAGVRRVHPDRQQGRRSHRTQAGVRAGPARLRHRCVGDGARPEPDRDHHLLGDARWDRRVTAAARHAVPHPRQLRRRRAEEGLRPGRGGGRDRRRRRTAARRVHHHLPVVARRVRARGRHHRGRPVRHQTGPRRALHGAPGDRPGGRGPVRSGHGRHRAGNPGVAGGWRVGWCAPGDRCGRAGRAGVLARAAQASREAGTAGPGSVPLQDLPTGDLRADAPADRPGRHDDRAADLPADGARVQRDAGGLVPRAALAQHVRSGGARGEEGRRPAPEQHHPAGDSCF